MPVIKPIAGHTSVRSVSDYLQKDGRALAVDLYNLSWDEDRDAELDPDLKQDVDWAAEMDLTRIANGNNTPWRGKRARTYMHFIVSPDPKDKVTLPQLRERHLVFRVGGDDEVHVGSRALAAPWGVVAVGDAGEVHLGRPVDVLLQVGVELRVSVLVPREVVQVDGQGAAVLLEVVGDAANAGVPGYGFYNGHASHRLRSWSRLCPPTRTRSPGGPARLLRASPRPLTASGRTCRTQAGSPSG